MLLHLFIKYLLYLFVLNIAFIITDKVYYVSLKINKIQTDIISYMRYSENMNNKDIYYKLIDNLRKYAELEGSNYGDMCLTMCQLLEQYTYISDDMLTALVIDMQKQLQYFKDNCEIVKRSITNTSQYVDLKWDNR